ncbi:hypothetical protein J2Y63_006944 [Shinella sp. BE166]|uniref:hypothetical protein n=1 Tax=Shinella sp. BE166 TaxID=3373918 RepID=UPI003EBF2609
MKDANSRKRRRRRSCYDRLRMRMIERRRARRANPAQYAALQLLALFSFILGGAAPPAQALPRYTPPPMSPRHAQRLELARRLDVPSRYVDIFLSQGFVPYARLFEDIRRGGVSRRDAVVQLRKRVPEASLDWLDYIQKWDRWSELLRCYVPHEREDLTDVRVLESTLRWVENLKRSTSGQPGATLETTGVDTDPQKPKT